MYLNVQFRSFQSEEVQSTFVAEYFITEKYFPGFICPEDRIPRTSRIDLSGQATRICVCLDKLSGFVSVRTSYPISGCPDMLSGFVSVRTSYPDLCLSGQAIRICVCLDKLSDLCLSGPDLCLSGQATQICVCPDDLHDWAIEDLSGNAARICAPGRFDNCLSVQFGCGIDWTDWGVCAVEFSDLIASSIFFLLKAGTINALNTPRKETYLHMGAINNLQFE